MLLSAILALLGRSVWVARASGLSPYAFGRRDTAHDFVGAIFRRTIGVFVFFFAFRALFPDSESAFGRVDWLASEPVGLSGLGLVLASVIWIVAAQAQMGRSWRVGIPDADRPRLITHGLFSISRNPVFLGMMAMALGLFLASPTAITLMALTATWLGIQIQVRLEEQHLRETFGSEYTEYTRRVRRWV
jgi:protein-S-isoprenylcysteine O-methyltransferase Ste14